MHNNWAKHILRVDQNGVYTPYMTIYLKKPLQNKLTHGIYMVLAKPTNTPCISKPT